MSRTPYKPRSSGALKAAVSELVTAVGGGPVAAELTRVSKTQMARYTDDAEVGTYMPVDIVHTLEAAAGAHPVTAWLAAAAGCALHEVPVGPTDEGTVWNLTPDFVRQAAEVIAKTLDVESDGVVDEAEAGAVIHEIDRLLPVLMQMRKVMVQIKEGDND